MSNNTGMKTDEQWAQEGYVLVRLRDCNGGIVDPVYVLRQQKYRGCMVVTPREKEDIIRRAKKIHKGNVRRRMRQQRDIEDANLTALRPYKALREQRLERERKEQRRMAVKAGKINFDEMTFFDLLNNS